MNIALPPIEDVIAHRGNMLLLDRLISVDAESCRSEYKPRADGWYIDAAGNMPAWIGIELMAQTVAAYVGMHKHAASEPPKQGVLLGTRSYKAAVPFYPVGACLCMEVRVSFRDDSGLGAFECKITLAGNQEQALATATLKVYEPEDFDAFMKGKHP